ncbi:MAG: acyl-homoserine-lactone synthase [Paracoccaceae bacterium]
MIIVIDALNKHRFEHVLDEMYRLRARVFADRLGWDVQVHDGKEIDEFDALDPAYVVGLDEAGHVVSCVRALQTTGPHMLSDVFVDILDGEPPLRSAQLWESTRFCVDTNRLGGGKAVNSVSWATCELMIGSLEFAMRSGIRDIVTVIDPVMNRVLKRSDCAPYDYVGKTVPMGKVSAMAALLDCTPDRIDRLRAFAGISHDVFGTEEEALALFRKEHPEMTEQRKPLSVAARTDAPQTAPAPNADDLRDYCRAQIDEARTPRELDDALALAELLLKPRSRNDRAAG